MKFWTLLISILSTLSFNHEIRESNQNDTLFLISENGKLGYINSVGKTIIDPIYKNAQRFSEGLAPVRINGTYGYINRKGKFVLEPIYDYATRFSVGLAIVYLDGKPIVINKEGEQAFDCIYPAIEPFENGMARIRTASKEYGYIDTTGRLIIDTSYAWRGPFIDGLAVVKNHNLEEKEKTRYHHAVIDTLGNFVIPFYKYDEISDFTNGYFKVSLKSQPNDTSAQSETAIIDRNGKIIISHNSKDNCWIDDVPYCGLIKMRLNISGKPYKKGFYFDTYSHTGFMNLKGEIVINDTLIKSANNFSSNRAIARDKDFKAFIIKPDGSKLSTDSLDGIHSHMFENGYVIASYKNKEGILDTNGVFVIKPQFEEIISLDDEYFFIQKTDPNDKYGKEKLYGVCKINGKVLIPPIMEEFDKSKFSTGLLLCSIDGKLTYFNKKGKIVWQGKNNENIKPSYLNIDYMKMGYFDIRANGPIETYDDVKNLSNRIGSLKGKQKNTISVFVDTTNINANTKNHYTYPVKVFNTTNKKVLFKHQDRRLYMNIQALDKCGDWKNIEYLPRSSCGNSYGSTTLNSKHYWLFSTPKYEGDFKTKLRIELKYLDPYSDFKEYRKRKTMTAYSNEYSGSVNPGQFWREEDYMPEGIMDSYYD